MNLAVLSSIHYKFLYIKVGGHVGRQKGRQNVGWPDIRRILRVWALWVQAEYICYEVTCRRLPEDGISQRGSGRGPLALARITDTKRRVRQSKIYV